MQGMRRRGAIREGMNRARAEGVWVGRPGAIPRRTRDRILKLRAQGLPETMRRVAVLEGSLGVRRTSVRVVARRRRGSQPELRQYRTWTRRAFSMMPMEITSPVASTMSIVSAESALKRAPPTVPAWASLK
jgi:hypothetical protein